MPNPSKSASRFSSIWLSDKSAWPLFGCIGAAGALVVFYCGRHLFSHPDIYVGKGIRSEVIRDNTDQGEKHHQHFIRKWAIHRVPLMFPATHGEKATHDKQGFNVDENEVYGKKK